MDARASSSAPRLPPQRIGLPEPTLNSGQGVVPGLIATEHSGQGKSNQLFLRGFNLDHGTDFAAHLDGVPLSFRTHGHGQGYLDLNFLIPEIVESVDFRKGPYRADVGDFSSGCSSFMRTVASREKRC